MSEERIQQAIDKSRRIRIYFVITAAILLAVVVPLEFYPPELPIFHSSFRDWFNGLVIALLVTPPIGILRKRKTWAKDTRASLEQMAVEITPSAVIASGPFGFQRELRVGEIVRIEEPSLGAGLYLRTSNRYRSILISRKLEGYEESKRELSQFGIPQVPTTLPMNWEEVLFVLLFMGTMLCAAVAHNRPLLVLNFLVTLLLVAGGFYIANASGLEKLQRNMRIGSCVPLIFSAVALILKVKS
jgi:hypothetical protein